DYYRFTQWWFLFLYKQGLAYQKEAAVNWCGDCQTVLANEQVIDGKCDRCKNPVIQKKMKQWFFRITDFLEKKGKTSGLLDGLDKIDWPESTKTGQRNWIGKSEGAEVDFALPTKPCKVLMIHCFECGSDTAWQPYLREKLLEKGFDVRTPTLPNSAHPDFAESMAFLEKEAADFGEEDIVIGHSLGGYFALKLSEKKKFGKLILVAPAYSRIKKEMGVRAAKEGSDIAALLKVFANDFDLDKVKANQKIAYFGGNDNWIPLENSEEIKRDFEIKVFEDFGHFQMKELPQLLDVIIPKLRVFTTRPDTLFGATFMVVAPEHSIVQNLKSEIKNWKEVEKYLEEASRKTELARQAEKEKTGVKLEGISAINPVNGKETPIFVADYVLMGYGTGAIMAVPAHDSRDFEFAQKFKIPVIEVVKAPKGIDEKCFTGDGVAINSGEFDGLPTVEVKKKIIAQLEKAGVGKSKITYKMRDWLVSRQRYWGAPIPIIHCEKCGAIPVAEADLPVKLPTDVDFHPTGESPLVISKSFHAGVACPQCGGAARRECDTMDTFVCSSWYYFRYADPRNSKEFASKELLKQWLPVDLYVGGAEHTVLHLLYSRFFTKAAHAAGLIQFDEPFLKLRHQGMILGEDSQKMSKSLGNVINPDEIVKEFGADTLRMYEMFMGPFEGSCPWSTKGVIGLRRFLEKVWRLYEKVSDSTDAKLEKTLHKTIKKVSEDIDNFGFNTAISQMMIFVNEATGEKEFPRAFAEKFLLLLAPFAPHFTEELWEKLGNKTSIHSQPWPAFDAKLTIDSTITLAIQINGKLRDTIEVAADISKEEAIKLAKASPNAAKWLEGNAIKKEIYVTGKLVSFVVGQSGSLIR
ncbi:MAG: leucine--tRNA ligase, partial [Candidatus Gracilibacteria bacterium]